MSVKKMFLWVFALLATGLFGQEFQFVAKASKTNLGINQRLKVEFSLNQDGADGFRAPDFENFRVVAGPSTSVSQSWINGKTTYNMSYVYFLEPKSKGNFIVEAARISFQGKEYYSNVLNIIVTDKIEDPNDPQQIINNTAQENIFLSAHVSKENPYVGESIYVEYRLYFSNNIEFNNPEFGDMPKYEGFWNQEIPIQNYDKQIGDVKGQKFNYFTLKKAVLIPQKTGKLNIGSIDMDVVVGVPTGKYDFFGYPLIQRINQHYSSGSRTIHVKSLPEIGKPENFTGAVGEFKFEVIPNKTVLNANQSARIDVKVNGLGNIKLFELPQLIVPSELEVYNPERNENIKTTLSGLSGNIMDSYSIVPNTKGRYPIPSLSFSYFNPKENKYYTLQSQEIVIEVTEDSKMLTSNNEKNFVKPSSNGNEFKYIATQTELNNISKNDFYGSLLHYGLLTFPFLVIPLFILIGNKHKEKLSDIVGVKKREADRLSRKYLSEAKKHLGNKELFYESLERALHNFLKAKLGIETSDISQENIVHLLKEKNVNDMYIQQFLGVLNDCNFARYTPMVKQAMEAELDKAALAIQYLNGEIK